MPERRVMDLVQWREVPPALRVLRVPVLSPKPTQSLTTLVICDEHALVDTHYVRDRTTGCIGRANGCEGCIGGVRIDTKLYFGVWWPSMDRCWAAEIPHGGIGDVWPTVVNHRDNLRGLVLIQTRKSAHKQGRVRAWLRPQTPAEKRDWVPPPPFNLKESLAQVWINLRQPAPPAAADDQEGQVPQ